jgi:hypothetical protein
MFTRREETTVLTLETSRIREQLHRLKVEPRLLTLDNHKDAIPKYQDWCTL